MAIDALGVSIGATQIIRQVSFKVESGEILGLVGASGSGKSLTALAVMQLLPAQAVCTGDLRLSGENLIASSERRLQQVRGPRRGNGVSGTHDGTESADEHR